MVNQIQVESENGGNEQCDLGEHMKGAKVIDFSLDCVSGQHQVIIEFDNGFIMKTLFDSTMFWHPTTQ